MDTDTDIGRQTRIKFDRVRVRFSDIPMPKSEAMTWLVSDSDSSNPLLYFRISEAFIFVRVRV